jgi:hypothetical protein
VREIPKLLFDDLKKELAHRKQLYDDDPEGYDETRL